MMEVIIVLSMALLFRLIVWDHMKTYLFMLRCRRNVKHINKLFADIEKRLMKNSGNANRSGVPQCK